MSRLVKLCAPAVFLALAGGVATLPTAAQGTKKVEKKEVITKKETTVTSSATAVFEVYQDKGKEYRFRLKADDKMIAISGKGYDTLTECEAVIREIQQVAARAKITHADKK